MIRRLWAAFPRRRYQSITLRFLRWLWRAYRERLTPAGRWFAWSALFFGLFGAFSLDVQTYLLFCYAAGLWLVALIAARLFRPAVKLEVHRADRICAGETLPLEVVVRQPKRSRTVDLRVVPYGLPRQVQLLPANGATVDYVGGGETARARMGLRCEKRGVYQLAGYRVQSAFPLHLVYAQQTVPREGPLVVYPRFRALARLSIEAGRRYQPGGVALASSMGEAFEYVGNREYREGDSIRSIDWRATARLNRPIVREYREEYFLRVGVILDTQVARSPRATREARRDAFEHAVSLCAAVSDFMARQEYVVDLFAAGPSLFHLTAGRSLAYLDQILDILACVEETETPPFEQIEPQLLEYLGQITTIVCIFLDWDESRRAFALRLKQQGVGIKAVVVRDGDPALDPSADAAVLGEIPVLSRSELDAGIEEL